jgi:asparagine synthase (glutamine-hydrolysing)
MAFARITAQHFNMQQHEYYVTREDVVDAVPKIAAHYDEPFGNSSTLPTYLCARLAAQNGIDCMLAGDGGDEVFAGNTRYIQKSMFDTYARLPRALRRGAIEPLIACLPGRERSRAVRWAHNFVRIANLPLPDRMEVYNSFADLPLTAVFEDDLAAAIDRGAPLQVLREAFQRTDSDSTLHRLMHMDLKIILADGDLRKVNGACQLAGIDVRYPFMDDDVVGMSGRVPPDLLVKDRRIRHFYKEAFSGFLPPEILAKPKQGFGLPTIQTMKSHAALQDLAFDSVSSFRRRGYLKPEFLDNVMKWYRAADTDTHGSGMLSDIMVLELWLCAHADVPAGTARPTANSERIGATG